MKKKLSLLKNWKKYLPIIGILLFIYILIKVDLLKVVDEVSKANLYFLLMALVLIIILFFSETFKWYTIAFIQGINIPFFEAFKINLICNFYGFVTPSKLGTVIRAEYLKRYTENIGKGLCNFTLDKILDLSSIIFITILFSFVFKDKLDLPIGVFVAMFLGFVLLTLFFINKNRSKFILKLFFNKLVPDNLRDKAKLTFNSFYDNIPKKRYFILFFFFNSLNWIIIYSVTYFIGLSLGINLPYIYYLAILPIGTLVTMIPISINGLGTREAALISLFALFGIEAAKVFSMSILSLGFGIIPAIIGSFLIFKERL